LSGPFFQTGNPTYLSDDTFRIEVLVVSVYIKDLSVRTLEPARAVICGSAVLPALELGVLAVEFDTIFVRAIGGREMRVFWGGFGVGEG